MEIEAARKGYRYIETATAAAMALRAACSGIEIQDHTHIRREYTGKRAPKPTQYQISTTRVIGNLDYNYGNTDPRRREGLGTRKAKMGSYCGALVG